MSNTPGADPEIRYVIISENLSMEQLAYQVWEDHQIIWYNDRNEECKRTWFTGSRKNAEAHADHELARLYGRYYRYVGFDDGAF